MAFDQSTRNRLQKLVSDCRKLLSAEFSIQLQQTYGIDPHSGEVADELTNLHYELLLWRQSGLGEMRMCPRLRRGILCWQRFIRLQACSQPLD